MKVLIFTQHTSISVLYGVGVYIRQLKTIFRNSKYELYLIQLHNDTEELTIIKNHQNTIINVPINNSNGVEKCIAAILSLYISDIENSICIFNHSSQLRWANYFKERFCRIKIIRVIHSFEWAWHVYGCEKILIKCLNKKKVKSDFDSDKVKNIFSNEKNGLDKVDRIVALSSDSINLLRESYGVDSNKISFIPNGIKDTSLRKKTQQELRSFLSIGLDEKIILYVGRLDILKGLDVLINSFNRVIARNKNCKLVIIGNGDFSILSKNIKMAASKIIFTGRISQKELNKWYNIADMAVMPSYSEECSFVGIEIMMHGLPIVATNGRGVRNMFHHMQNCLSVDCQSGQKLFEKELSEAILQILNSETLANDLRKKTRQWYLDHYQLKFMKGKYLSLLEDLTK